MARPWQFNPPPNWPVPTGEPALDWQPDPAWGPPPVGWELWRRRRVPSLRRRRLVVLAAIAGLVTVAAVQLTQVRPYDPKPSVPQSTSLRITLTTQPDDRAWTPARP